LRIARLNSVKTVKGRCRIKLGKNFVADKKGECWARALTYQNKTMLLEVGIF
jgi:hypothetical protein